MKTFLLAAGEGRRLRPLTNTTPKCLVPINGKPLLAIWLQHCFKHGISDVLINLHYLHEQVKRFIDTNECRAAVTTVYERRLLGSAGTVAANQSFVAGERDFFIIYADNLTNVDLGEMLQFHRQRHSLFTMGLFRTDTPQEKGIAVIDADGLITDFIEKPSRPSSNLANAGIYVASQELYSYLPAEHAIDASLDFGFDILPKLVGKMIGYIIEGFFLDIGNPEAYQEAQKMWPGVKH